MVAIVLITKNALQIIVVEAFVVEAIVVALFGL